MNRTHPTSEGATAIPPKYDCEMGDPLDMLAEECAEVIQAIMKARRFGFDGAPGYAGIKPRAEIIKEIGDVLACIDILQGGGTNILILEADLQSAKKAKLSKLREYFRNAPSTTQ